MILAHNLRLLVPDRSDPAVRLASAAFVAALELPALALAPEDLRTGTREDWWEALEWLREHLDSLGGSSQCVCELPGWVCGQLADAGTLSPVARVKCSTVAGSGSAGGARWRIDSADRVCLAQPAVMVAAAITQATEVATALLSIDGVLEPRARGRLAPNHFL